MQYFFYYFVIVVVSFFYRYNLFLFSILVSYIKIKNQSGIYLSFFFFLHPAHLRISREQ